MKTVHLNYNDPTVSKIIAATFPGCRKIQANLTNKVRFNNTLWSAGCRSQYKLLELATMKVIAIEEAPFLQQSKLHEMEHTIPPGYVCVQFNNSGMYTYIIIISPPENVSALLPAPVNLTDDEKIVLKYTKEYKSSYAGISNYRFYEARRTTGITWPRWGVAKENLIKEKFLNKRGAITTKGRNAAQ